MSESNLYDVQRTVTNPSTLVPMSTTDSASKASLAVILAATLVKPDAAV